MLSLLYPDRDWKDAVFHEDHIFPKSAFKVGSLRSRGYDEAQIHYYIENHNSLPNLQLLTETENLSKNATPFDDWIQTRDPNFRNRHLVPDLSSCGFDHFREFIVARRRLIVESLKALQ